MRFDAAVVLGAIIGAIVVWRWGRTIEDRIVEIRTRAADGIQAVEETIRPA
ncbi:MAG TPA: hypothetical protein VML54_10580 [Candidatus Limnocylindrales bacterium]|nr:hypothetical protein [Candidatus Limnocylindrales bacterium]